MNEIVATLKRPFIKLKNKSHPFWFFAFLFLLGVLMSLYILLNNDWTIPLSGDFVQQEIAFYYNGYDDWWHFFKTGEFPLWDSNTILGVNNIASNSFYYFLNPFFFPILLVPRSIIPQAQAMMMLIKMALAGMTMRSYLKYMGIKEKNARIFALAYAFCGWNMYYLWFNHFLEIAVMFPLIMLGIEHVLREKKPWLLILSVFVMGLCNYTFLVSSCIAGVMYAGFRFFQRVKLNSAKDNATIFVLGVFGFAMGIMICAFVLLPCFMDASSNPRVEDANFLETLKNAYQIKNWKLFFNTLFKFDWEKKTYYPLITFLFPVVSDFSPIFFNNKGYDNTLGSIFVYTPLILLFVPSFINSVKKKKVSHLIAIAVFILLLFTPFFYWLSFAFAKEYGRWQIFATFALIVYIAISFEDKEKWPKWYLDASLGVVLSLMALTIYICLSKQDKYIGTGEINEIGERIYAVYYQVIYAIVVYIIMRVRFNKPKFNRVLMGLLSLEVIIMSNIIYQVHGVIPYSSLFGGKSNNKDEAKIVNKINDQDDDYFRIFNTTANRSTNNLGMVLNYNGLGGFHSAYNYQIEDFLLWSRIPYFNMTWTMGEHEKLVNIEEFLGVKYYIIRNSDYYLFDGEQNTFNINHINVPYGFRYDESLSTSQHTVFVNTNYIPLGFAFDDIILADKYSVTLNTGDSSNLVKNEEAFLKGAILYPQDIYSDFKQEEYDKKNNYTEVKEYFDSLTIDNSLSKLGEIKFNRSYDANVNYISGTKYKCATSFDPIHPIDTSTCSISNELGYEYNRTIFEYKKSDHSPLLAEDATSRGGAYIRMNLAQSSYAFVYLYDENDELITFDYHQYIDSSFKMLRGFYVDRPVYKVVIRPMTTARQYERSIPTTIGNYIQYYDSYLDYLEPLKSNKFKNVVSTTNKHTFDTSYISDKFVVLNVTYDDGWSIKVKHEDGTISHPKLFKAHGGFVGFVAPSGNNHIEVSYMTPYLKIGTLVSFIGVTISGVSFGVVYYLKKRKKKTINPFLDVDDGEIIYDEDFF